MAPEFRTESMIHRAVRQSIGYANAAVPHPRLTLSLAPSRGYRLTVLPCSDKTCRPPRHIAYDPDRTARKTNGRDAKTSSSYLLRPGLFRDEDSAGLPESRKRCNTAKKSVEETEREREREKYEVNFRKSRADLKYYLPGKTYILKLVLVAGKLHAKMSFRVM
ncbi:hypothetical protein ALC57_06601 [Trachymyrmex cornetzi]|uniref:Uncharacterized protein n=1 Tax=Trachymyrmex cornetzi TaxID=471704 RepID=A0A151J864_9HYME|nr:hypothetical protein ALC57_06601 [Trachymyrmex cornetzi]